MQPLLEATGLKAGRDFFLAFSPERVDPGNPTFQTHNVPKVVGGLTPACVELASALYGSAIDTIVPVSSTRVAEMVKLLENTFRAVNIGLVNELALMCDRMAIDVWEVVDAAKTKPFGFMAFYPGPGLGGHCIPIDPFYLSWKAKQSGFDPRFIELAGHINGGMPHYVVDKIAEALNTKRKAINGSKVLIAGVAYKRDIDDMRESPALDVMGLLHARGAQVSYVDPHVPEVHGREWSGRFDVKAVERGPRVVRSVRLHRGDHRPQVVRLRRDGRRVGFDRRHPERDQDAGAGTSSSSALPAPRARPSPSREPGSDRGQTHEAGGLPPDGLQAPQELMIVVQHVQDDVGTRLRPALDRRRIDRSIAPSLKDLDRQIDFGVERVVARRIGVELEMDRHQPAEPIVEHLEPIRAAPFLDAAVAHLPHAVATEIERRRQQHEPIDPSGVPQGGVDGHEPAQARSDERDRPGPKRLHDVVHLAEHAAHRQGREVGRVEVRGVHGDAVRLELRAEERGLGRLGGRGKAVQVDDVHQRITLQPGRQRHGIEPAPPVL